jgi:hypothetical protein
MVGIVMLEVDYFFSDDPIHGTKTFRWRFWIKELFMKIVQGVREYDDYLNEGADAPIRTLCKGIGTGLPMLLLGSSC